MNSQDIYIRPAQQNDLSAAYALIKELALFEKEPNEPTNSFNQFKEDFSKNQFECLVAINSENIIGIALYFWGYSTWKGKMLFLDDLVVKEEFRKNKVGSQLFNAIMKVAKEESANLVKWQVLDWNTPAIKMYEKVNAIFDTGWWNCKLEKEEILNYTEI
ncbi:MAG: GNAT family N-acetyltransferase [Chitinophagales bacterium]